MSLPGLMSLASRMAWRERWRKDSIGAAYPKRRTTGGFYAGACPRSRRFSTAWLIEPEIRS